MPVIESTVKDSKGTVATIYIEVDDPHAIITPNPFTQTRSNPFEDTRDGEQVVTDVFNKGMELIRNCAEQIVTTVHKVDQTARPSEFEVQLSIKLDSQVGAILAKTSAEAQLQVTLKWVKKDKETHE